MRPRTAKAVNRTLVLVALGWLTVAGAAVAHADVIDDYTADNGWAVCRTLDTFPNEADIEGIGAGIADDGLTYEAAGAVIAKSVMLYCPEHMDVLQAFVAKWAPVGRVVA